MPFEFPTETPPRDVFMRRGEGNAFMNVSYPHGFLHQPMGGPVLDLAKLFEPSTGLGVELDAHSGCIHCCPEVALPLFPAW
jgi:hypothetical protein